MSKKNMQYIDVANDFTEEEEAVFKPVAVAEKPKQEAAKPKVEASSLDAHVAAQYRAGMNIKDIKATNNISAGKIYGILDRMGVQLRTGRYKTASGDRIATMTNMEKQTLIDNYLRGVSLETLYRAHNLNKHGVYRVLDEANIPRRHKHTSTEAKPEAAAETTEAKRATYTPTTAEKFAGAQVFNAVIAQPVEQPVVADVSMKDTGLHITLNRKHLTSAENINITITVAG